MDFEEIQENVINWSAERGIFRESGLIEQFSKLYEEQGELIKAIMDTDQEAIIDAIGDMMVVLTNIAQFTGVSLVRCYYTAYQQIKDRKGKMVNGIFVKEKKQ